MLTPENKRKELEHILNRENFVKITGAVKALREESPFPGAISLLVSFYDRTDNSSVRRIIEEFLNDLKDQNSCREVVDEISKTMKPETLRMLVSSCWQSGLDYAPYSSVFARLFLSDDYMTSVECYTVIESSTEKLDKAGKDEVIRIISNGMSNANEGIKSLARDLVAMMK
ncbi:MAG: hypothetical protein RBT38_08550 [Bacteroidales bacterium]|jgi:hypothetical protein|nr:hypothetical protein [Bacteroidales bacterium]